MLRYCRLALLLSPLLGTISGPIEAQDFSQLRQKVKASVAYIETTLQKRDGTDREVVSGTAFVISPDGYAITAAHVVPPPATDGIASYRASMRSRYAPKFPVEIVTRDDDLDLALLYFPRDIQTWQKVDFGNSTETPEDARLYTLGFPRSSDLASGEGLLSARFGGGRGRWQTTLPLDHGNSGGPVFDIGGRVVGVAVGGLDEARAITYVVPSNYTRAIRSLALAQFNVPLPSATAKTNSFFAYTADYQEQKEVDKQFCLESKYRVTAFTPNITATYGQDTKVLSITPTIGKENCVSLKAIVSGNGVDKIGPIVVGQKGAGGLAGSIFIGGELK